MLFYFFFLILVNVAGHILRVIASQICRLSIFYLKPKVTAELMLCSLCPLGGASRCGAPDFQTAEETRGLCHSQKIRGNAHKLYDTLCFN